MIKKKCEQCGKEYSPNRKTQKFCSEKCQIRSRYKPFNCIVCGKTFYSKHPNRKFCSNKCSATRIHKASKVELSCKNCGTNFTRNKSRVRGKEVGNFCTRTCWDKYNSRMKGEQSHRWNSKKVECEYCGEMFVRQENQLKTREKRFCSHVCYSHWLEENTKGENSYSWRGGVNTFRGDNWDEVSSYIRQRDNFQCQDCGDKTMGVQLDVHHKIPFRFFDDPDKANHEDNLITLCRSCHGKQESHWWKEVPEKYKQYM